MQLSNISNIFGNFKQCEQIQARIIILPYGRKCLGILPLENYQLDIRSVALLTLCASNIFAFSLFNAQKYIYLILSSKILGDFKRHEETYSFKCL